MHPLLLAGLILAGAPIQWKTPGNAAPVLPQIGEQIVRGTAVQELDFRAVDSEGDAVIYMGHNLPPGFTLRRDGLVRWDTSVSGWGYQGEGLIIASDGRDADVEVVHFQVTSPTNKNRPPQIEAPLHAAARPDCTLDIPVRVSDPDGDAVSVDVRTFVGRQDIHEHPGLPEGAVFDAEAGFIRWTPRAHQAGRDVHLVVHALDRVAEHGLASTRTVTVRVLPPAPPTTPVGGPVDELTGRWRVVERLAEVPVAPRTIEFLGNGKAITELVDYDLNRDLAQRVHEQFEIRVRRNSDSTERGTLWMKSHRGEFKSAIYRTGDRIILDSYFGRGGLVLDRCTDADCSEVSRAAAACQDVGVFWQGEPTHG